MHAYNRCAPDTFVEEGGGATVKVSVVIVAGFVGWCSTVKFSKVESLPAEGGDTEGGGATVIFSSVNVVFCCR